MLLNPTYLRKSQKKRVSIKSKSDGKQHPERKATTPKVPRKPAETTKSQHTTLKPRMVTASPKLSITKNPKARTGRQSPRIHSPKLTISKHSKPRTGNQSPRIHGSKVTMDKNAKSKVEHPPSRIHSPTLSIDKNSTSRTGNRSPTHSIVLSQSHADNILHFKKLKKEVNAELHYLKYQLKQAEEKAHQLQQTCDQQAKELEKCKAAKLKLTADVKSLTEQNKRLQLAKGNAVSHHNEKAVKKERSKAEQTRAPDAKTKSVHAQKNGEPTNDKNAPSRETDASKDQPEDPTHEQCIPKPEFSELVEKHGWMVDEVRRVKSQLKNQEAAFRDLQMELANDKEVKMITEEIQNHQQHSQLQRLELQLERIITRELKNSSGVMTVIHPPPKQKPAADGPGKLIPNADVSILENMLKERTIDNIRLNKRLIEQQRIIDEQWKLVEQGKADIEQEKTLVAKTWKLKVDELQSKVKEYDHKLTAERTLYEEELSKVQATAKNNIDKLIDRLDQLVGEMKTISVQQDRTKNGTSTVVEENACLKDIIKQLKRKLKEQRANESRGSDASHSLVQVRLAVPRTLYEDDLLTDVLDQLSAFLENRVVLHPMESGVIAQQHKGPVLLPLLGSPTVVADIQEALDNVNLDDVSASAIVLILHQLTPSHSALYTATRHKLRDPELLARCRGVVDLVHWNGFIYDCAANSRGAMELKAIIEK